MNIVTGEIREHYDKLLASLSEKERENWRPMEVPPTPQQLATGKVGRNHTCPCGSGSKFKNCCMIRMASWIEATDASA